MMAASADRNRTPEWCCRPLRPVQCRRREKACHPARMQGRAATERRGVDGLLYANSGSDRILALDHWVDPSPRRSTIRGSLRKNTNRLTVVGKATTFPWPVLLVPAALVTKSVVDLLTVGASASPKSFSCETSFVAAIKVASLTRQDIFQPGIEKAPSS
jgi:hypothetical protein